MNTNIIYDKVVKVITSSVTEGQLIVAGKYAQNFVNLNSDNPNIQRYVDNLNLLIESRSRKIYELCQFS